MSHVVYALVDEFGSPRYVGQTSKSLHHRLSQHHSAARNGPRALDAWLRSASGITIIPLEVDPPNVDAAERRWIAQLRSSPAISLLNLYDGGRRAPTGYVWPEEARKRQSAHRKGKPLSVEHRAKLSAAHTGVPISEAHREAIGRGGRGLKMSDEARANIRAAKLGDLNPMSRAQRAKRKQAQQGGEAL